jgi:uncharacterized protein (TIGR02453 family)
MSITPDLFEFLRELKVNNNREWFQANKSRYENDVKKPLFDFIEAFGDRLPAISPHYQAIPRVNGGSLFRIYRDVRFSKDKTPYKTAAALHIRHESARDVHSPGFYLHLEPGEVFVSCGIWKPTGDTVYRIRTRISQHPDQWLATINEKKFSEVYTLGGDSLIRPPKGFDPDHQLIVDLKRKDYLASIELNEDAALQSDFFDKYVELCQQSAPFMRFLTESIGLPW